MTITRDHPCQSLLFFFKLHEDTTPGGYLDIVFKVLAEKVLMGHVNENHNDNPVEVPSIYSLFAISIMMAGQGFTSQFDTQLQVPPIIMPPFATQRQLAFSANQSNADARVAENADPANDRPCSAL